VRGQAGPVPAPPGPGGLGPFCLNRISRPGQRRTRPAQCGNTRSGPLSVYFLLKALVFSQIWMLGNKSPINK
jgi:hypothetical protein